MPNSPSRRFSVFPGETRRTHCTCPADPLPPQRSHLTHVTQVSYVQQSHISHLHLHADAPKTPPKNTTNTPEPFSEPFFFFFFFKCCPTKFCAAIRFYRSQMMLSLLFFPDPKVKTLSGFRSSEHRAKTSVVGCPRRTARAGMLHMGVSADVRCYHLPPHTPPMLHAAIDQLRSKSPCALTRHVSASDPPFWHACLPKRVTPVLHAFRVQSAR